MRLPLLALVLFMSVLFVAGLGWWLGRPAKTPTTPTMETWKTTTAHKRASAPAAFMGDAATPATITAPSAVSELAELPRLVAALKAAETQVERRKLAQAIVAQGTTDAAEALWQTAIAQTNPELRTAILEGLDSVVSPEMITFTASVLKASADLDILNAAKQLIARGADMDTVGFLTELYTEAGTTEPQQHQIENAVSTIRTEAATSALGALARNTESPRLAEAAAVSLFTLRTPATMQALNDAKAALTATSSADAEPLLRGIDRLLNQATKVGSVPETTDPATLPP